MAGTDPIHQLETLNDLAYISAFRVVILHALSNVLNKSEFTEYHALVYHIIFKQNLAEKDPFDSDELLNDAVGSLKLNLSNKLRANYRSYPGSVSLIAPELQPFEADILAYDKDNFDEARLQLLSSPSVEQHLRLKKARLETDISFKEQQSIILRAGTSNVLSDETLENYSHILLMGNLNQDSVDFFAVPLGEVLGMDDDELDRTISNPVFKRYLKSFEFISKINSINIISILFSLHYRSRSSLLLDVIKVIPVSGESIVVDTVIDIIKSSSDMQYITSCAAFLTHLSRRDFRNSATNKLFELYYYFKEVNLNKSRAILKAILDDRFSELPPQKVFPLIDLSCDSPDLLKSQLLYLEHHCDKVSIPPQFIVDTKVHIFSDDGEIRKNALKFYAKQLLVGRLPGEVKMGSVLTLILESKPLYRMEVLEAFSEALSSFASNCSLDQFKLIFQVIISDDGVVEKGEVIKQIASGKIKAVGAYKALQTVIDHSASIKSYVHTELTSYLASHQGRKHSARLTALLERNHVVASH